MLIKELENDLKNNCYKNIYLFFGECSYLTNLYEKKFKQAIAAGPFVDMNLNIFDDSLDIDNLIDTICTVPFMSSHRLVIIKNANLFSSTKKANFADRFLKELETFPSSTIIIITEDAADKRLKLYKAILAKGTALEFLTPKEAELKKWVINTLNSNNITVSDSIALFFLRIVPYNMETINLELDKLIAYKGSQGELKSEDINLITTKSLEAKIFDMLDALCQKQLNLALELYNNMVSQKEEPLMILAMVARQFRLILRTKAMLKENAAIDEISKSLEIRSFAVKNYIAQSKHFKFNTLIDALEDCLTLDYSIKIGQIEKNLGLTMLLIKYGQ